MFATLLVATMMMSMMSLTAMAADKTMIHNDGDAYGLDDQNINININGTDYAFTGSGGKWISTSSVEELGLGRGESIPVTIIDEDGKEYDAQLSNHSNGMGNNKDSENGTDHYKLGGITLKEQPEQPLVEIPEEEVPLAAVPKTGDMMSLWMALSGISLAGMALVGKKGKEG